MQYSYTPPPCVDIIGSTLIGWVTCTARMPHRVLLSLLPVVKADGCSNEFATDKTTSRIPAAGRSAFPCTCPWKMNRREAESLHRPKEVHRLQPRHTDPCCFNSTVRCSEHPQPLSPLTTHSTRDPSSQPHTLCPCALSKSSQVDIDTRNITVVIGPKATACHHRPIISLHRDHSPPPHLHCTVTNLALSRRYTLPLDMQEWQPHTHMLC